MRPSMAIMKAIVKNTIDLGRSLGLHVVAEGAETQEHMDILESFGCDSVQGYFISRPLPPDGFEKWLYAYDANAKFPPVTSSALG